jgi:hypothetical protein
MRSSRIHDERAQGVVEFALIVTVLMLLFLGTADFARFLYYQSAIQNSARVGAEAAGKQCVSIDAACGTPSNDYVLQAAVCEAKPYVAFQMATSIVSCSPCGPKSTACANGPCGSSGCQACPTSGQDVCVSRDSTSTGCSTSQPCVTVSAGYNFQPISFFLTVNSWLFPARSCWGSDPTSNGHTLCASSEGRTS